MRNLIWGFILVILGIMLLLSNLGIADFEDILRDYWPLLLILWGLLILTRRKKEQTFTTDGSANVASAQVNESTRSVESDLVHDSNVFGNTFLTSTSQNFKGGSVSSIFGDCIIDLSKSVFADGEHVLRIHSVFGRTSVILPKEAVVSISASSTFGNLAILGQQKGGISASIDTKTNDYETLTRKMKILISQVFGDVRVS